MGTIEGKKLLSQSKWIWPEHRLYDIHNTYAHFRKDFTLVSETTEAILYIAADESYRLWINGKYVTRGPARGYQAKWPYDRIDILMYLHKGHNYVCVEAYNPGVSTYKYISQMSAGFICAADLGEVSLRSDNTWLARLDKAHKRDTALYSRQLNFQEHVDATKDDRSWITSQIPPEGWLVPEETVFGSMPWHEVEERGIPQLREQGRSPIKLVSSTKMELKEDYRAWRNIVQGLNQAFRGAIWTKGKGLLDNNSKINIEVRSAGRANYQAVVLDMGETVVGPSVITIEGGRQGEVVDIFYSEAVNEDLGPVIPFPALCEASMANRLILSGEKTTFDFYQILGFRYITLVAHENKEALKIQLEVIDTGYPYNLIKERDYMREKLYKKIFTMSFDDGTIQDRRFIKLIDKYNLKCTFNLNSGFFGQVHNIVHEGIEVCHDEVLSSEAKQLYNDHEIAVHTVNHPNLLNCSKEKIIEEVNLDFERLTELTGKTIIGMAYPGGPFYNDFVIETILKNTPIRYARTINSHKTFNLPDNFMEWHPTCHQNDEQIMCLAEEFVEAEPQKDMLFYLWGHSFEFDKYNSWENFENFCKFISSRSDITYMTNCEVYHYLLSQLNV